jgi:hypothetical protein
MSSRPSNLAYTIVARAGGLHVRLLAALFGSRLTGWLCFRRALGSIGHYAGEANLNRVRDVVADQGRLKCDELVMVLWGLAVMVPHGYHPGKRFVAHAELCLHELVPLHPPQPLRSTTRARNSELAEWGSASATLKSSAIVPQFGRDLTLAHPYDGQSGA